MFKKIILCAAASVLLVACDKKPETIELEFVELQQREDKTPRAIYVSHEAKAYYAVNLSSYEFNNFENLGIANDIEAKKDMELYDLLKFIDPYRYEDEAGNTYVFDYINDYYKGDGDEFGSIQETAE